MTPEELTNLYARIDTMVVALPADPTAQGPAGLHRLISTIRSHLNDLGTIIQRVAREKYDASRTLTLLRTDFEAESDRLLVDDQEVRRLPSMADRSARIRRELQDRVKALKEAELKLADLEFVEKTVKFRQQELQDTMSAVRLQRGLMDTEAHTTGYMGAEGDLSSVEALAEQDRDEETFQSILAHYQSQQESSTTDDSAILGDTGSSIEDLLASGLTADPDTEEPLGDTPATQLRSKGAAAKAVAVAKNPLPETMDIDDEDLSDFFDV